ncbi:hypothetical protein HDV05_003744 [Chytridiales sp. JEL 0842]|nr:hypothetical protein HDV05_003744 [Chytridiales sp. JEL 0842]
MDSRSSPTLDVPVKLEHSPFHHIGPNALFSNVDPMDVDGRDLGYLHMLSMLNDVKPYPHDHDNVMSTDKLTSMIPAYQEDATSGTPEIQDLDHDPTSLFSAFRAPPLPSLAQPFMAHDDHQINLSSSPYEAASSTAGTAELNDFYYPTSDTTSQAPTDILDHNFLDVFGEKPFIKPSVFRQLLASTLLGDPLPEHLKGRSREEYDADPNTNKDVFKGAVLEAVANHPADAVGILLKAREEILAKCMYLGISDQTLQRCRDNVREAMKENLLEKRAAEANAKVPSTPAAKSNATRYSNSTRIPSPFAMNIVKEEMLSPPPSTKQRRKRRYPGSRDHKVAGFEGGEEEYSYDGFFQYGSESDHTLEG